MKKKRPATTHTRWTHGRGIIRLRGSSYVAELNFGYRRNRRTFATLDGARVWLETAQIELMNCDRPLSVLELRDAREALNLLGNVTLIEAARCYLRLHARDVQSPVIERAVAEYLEEKHAAGLRAKSLEGTRSHLNRLTRTFAGRTVNSINTADLAALLIEIGATGTTWNNWRRAWATFFNWCAARHYCPENPARAISVARIDDHPPGILTVPQVRALIKATVKIAPELVPYFTVAAFAGLRRAELDRLDASAIGDDLIHVSARAAKMRAQRYVTVAPNLRAWLDAYPPSAHLQPLTPMTFRRRFEAVQSEAHIDAWPQNALRHSFASYHLAYHQNAALTAHELGHTDADLLFRHYRNLVTHAAAKEYWSIGFDTNL